MMSLGYEYRPDGNYLIRKTCSTCGEAFDSHAMANVVYVCPACEQVDEWMKSGEPESGGGR